MFRSTACTGLSPSIGIAMPVIDCRDTGLRAAPASGFERGFVKESTLSASDPRTELSIVPDSISHIDTDPSLHCTSK